MSKLNSRETENSRSNLASLCSLTQTFRQPCRMAKFAGHKLKSRYFIIPKCCVAVENIFIS